MKLLAGFFGFALGIECREAFAVGQTWLGNDMYGKCITSNSCFVHESNPPGDEYKQFGCDIGGALKDSWDVLVDVNDIDKNGCSKTYERVHGYKSCFKFCSEDMCNEAFESKPSNEAEVKVYEKKLIKSSNNLRIFLHPLTAIRPVKVPKRKLVFVFRYYSIL